MASPDGVAPSQMVGVPASVNLPLHHKVLKFSSGTGCPVTRVVPEKGRKMVVVWWMVVMMEGHLTCKNPIPVIPRSSLWEPVEKDPRGIG